ncbi:MULTISPECIES: NAD(P)-dependent oxidoreductase [Paenibacillus]|uniref:NAD-binding protein n=1 Tax=Paenibacillus campinasensis TaxID=66347 RepID=A0A268F3W9_9BACL|nr:MULTISPECIES: NAD(P)-dependent oxidoreductase [Paenibacillus]MUG64767.1 NAD-binding protein [Paenibacillus campinasensis]PAD80050.1 oxidoreductase [Paenibacillus campinasensis]PAK55477.1 oxidoreductase [Paenibacillus sp. 7541]
MTVQLDNARIGFIGTGVMGSSMAKHLQQGGYKLSIYTRTKAKAQELLDLGMEWKASPGELAAECDVVITMVGYPSDVRALYLGEDRVIDHARPGTYLIDMTTSSPLLAKQIYESACLKGLHALDAPVSGGDVGARNGTLSIMVGGDDQAFNTVLPIFEQMGNRIVLQGGPGAGQHTKMVNQIAIASNMVGVCEALVYAAEAGLDLKKVLSSIETGAAGSWSLSNLAPRIIEGDFEPGFYVKHFIKDMEIALQVADDMKIELPGLSLARQLYARIAEAGLTEKGTHALYLAWDKNEGAQGGEGGRYHP